VSETLSGNDFLIDWQAAEAAALVHMKTLGFIDAQSTGPGADGGIDALSSDAAAQVKFYANPVGRPDVQRLRGAAHEFRLALFYSTGGYTQEAVEYAKGAGVALFTMDPYGNCLPLSDLALLLSEPANATERRNHLLALQAVQYRLAAAALEADVELYKSFGKTAGLTGEESGLYSHVFTGLKDLTQRFRAMVEAHDFEGANSVFGAIKKRAEFLSWASGVELRDQYEVVEDAMQRGWQIDATVGAEYLLLRAATGIFQLKKLLVDSLEGWAGSFTVAPAMIDDDTTRLAGMLNEAGLDATMLTPELEESLKTALVQRVEQSRDGAAKAHREISAELKRMGIAERGVTSYMIRIHQAAAHVLEQLTAHQAR
jgi:hypothetical protein